MICILWYKIWHKACFWRIQNGLNVKRIFLRMYLFRCALGCAGSWKRRRYNLYNLSIFSPGLGIFFLSSVFWRGMSQSAGFWLIPLCCLYLFFHVWMNQMLWSIASLRSPQELWSGTDLWRPFFSFHFYFNSWKCRITILERFFWVMVLIKFDWFLFVEFCKNGRLCLVGIVFCVGVGVRHLFREY